MAVNLFFIFFFVAYYFYFTNLISFQQQGKCFGMPRKICSWIHSIICCKCKPFRKGTCLLSTLTHTHLCLALAASNVNLNSFQRIARVVHELELATLAELFFNTQHIQHCQSFFVKIFRHTCRHGTLPFPAHTLFNTLKLAEWMFPVAGHVFFYAFFYQLPAWFFFINFFMLFSFFFVTKK